MSLCSLPRIYMPWCGRYSLSTLLVYLSSKESVVIRPLSFTEPKPHPCSAHVTSLRIVSNKSNKK